MKTFIALAATVIAQASAELTHPDVSELVDKVYEVGKYLAASA